jgi:hypothetical protein
MKLSEMDDETRRNTGAVGTATGSVQADIIHLGAESQVREKWKIHTTAEAIGELVAGAAAAADSDA